MEPQWLVWIRLGIKVIARVEGVVALKVVNSAVILFRPGFETNVHNCSWLPSIFRRRLLLGVKFLNGIDGKVRCRSTLHAFGIDYRCRVVRIVVVDAIHDEVVVLGTISIGANREKTAARVALNTGPKGDKILKIAAIERQIVDGFIAYGAAQSVVRIFDERNIFGDRNRFGDRTGRQFEIDADVLSEL